jgi:hypothetical protein
MRPVVFGAALMLTACANAEGGGSEMAAADHAVAAAQPSAESARGDVAQGGHPGFTHGDAAAQSTSRATPPPDAASTPTAHDAITVQLEATCVMPGHAQTIRIITKEPASVTFTTHYADGSTGMDHGGTAIGSTDSRGTYRSAWIVGSGTPLGDATVLAGASSHGVTHTASPAHFTVAQRC